MRGDRFISKLHEHPDCCWRRVELGHLVFVHNAPQAALIGVRGDPLKLTPVKSGYFWLFPIVFPFPTIPSGLYLPFLINRVFTPYYTSQETF